MLSQQEARLTLLLMISCSTPQSGCPQCEEIAASEAQLYSACGITLPISDLEARCVTMGPEMYRCHVDCLVEGRCPEADYSGYFYDHSCEYECRQRHWDLAEQP